MSFWFETADKITLLLSNFQISYKKFLNMLKMRAK